MPRSPSLRSKLGWLVAAAVGASTAVATTVSIWQQVSSYGEVRRAALIATAEVFAAAAGPATADKNELRAFQTLRAIGAVPDIQQAEVRTLDGRRLASAGSSVQLTNDLSVNAEQDKPISILNLLASGTLKVKVPVVNAGERVGELVLVSGISGLWWKLIYTAIFTAAGGAFALLVGFLVSMRLQRHVTEPIHNLLGAMATVRQTHRYDLQVPDAKDREIGALVAGFNEMLRDVRERDDRLDAHRQNLEHEIAERTRDLKHARDAAESANHAKSDFLATMSHEIRTPMNGMMVMADILVGSELPARQRRYAEIIARSGRSLLSIINDILDFSKIEAGKLELEDVELDLNEIAESVVSLFAEQAHGKGVDLAAWVDPALPRALRGDPVRLTQIMTNLVNNALKFTTEGMVRIDVGFCTDDKSLIEIAVRDSGVGIPADKLKTIFESFSQADQSTTRHFGGTGLGLTICKRLADAMGGDIRVTSTVGSGSTFSVVIPCRASGESRWPRLASDQQGSRVCVLDIALPATADVLTRYLSAAGFMVVGPTADSAQTGPGLVCADASRLPVYATRSAGSLLVGLLASKEVNSAVDAVIGLPVLRSDVELLLARLGRDGRTLQRSESRAADQRHGVGRFSPFEVLVADDNAVNREVAQEALRGLGGIVTVVENGAQAIVAMKSRRFDIVFMDGSMPEVDGITAARHIRGHELDTNAPRTPIVGLTAHVVGIDARQWREAGMDTIVYKPFTVTQLSQSIETLLPQLPRCEKESDETDPTIPTSAATAAAETDEVLDHAVFGELIETQRAGQNDFARRIVHLYAENAPLAVMQFEEAAAKGDREGCARAAHSLKSMSFSIGASRVARHANDLEVLCRERSTLVGAPDIEALKEALSAAMREIDLRMRRGDQGNRPITAHANVAPDVEIERALQRGLEQQQFSLLYQPIVDRAGIMVGVEALLRWSLETGRQIPPTVFIPIAEKTGLIHDLGNWAMRCAFEDSKAWDGVDVSINVSPVQLMSGDFVSRVGRAISDSGVDPRRVVLEITESTLLSAQDTVDALMEHLRGLNLRFALDDFGTGYASLASLRQYPFDRIKIDRSFVSNLQTTADATIVHAVIAIAKSLGLSVVAEGVEQSEQWRFLTSAGVNFLQGYLFGRPMPKEDIVARLLSERATEFAGKAAIAIS